MARHSRSKAITPIKVAIDHRRAETNDMKSLMRTISSAPDILWIMCIVAVVSAVAPTLLR